MNDVTSLRERVAALEAELAARARRDAAVEAVLTIARQRERVRRERRRAIRLGSTPDALSEYAMLLNQLDDDLADALDALDGGTAPSDPRIG